MGDGRGRLDTISGGNVYPVTYGDDYDNRRVSLTTYRNGSADTTVWVYDEATGLLTDTLFADGKKANYTYTPDGKFASRRWARGVSTSYQYDPASGDLTTIDYSDATPDVSFSDFDTRGRPQTVTDGLGTHTLRYEKGRLLSETANGITVTHTYENGRLSGVTTGSGYAVSYGYDPATGRMTSATHQPGAADAQTFAYGYLPNSDLIHTVSSASGLSVTRTYETQRNLLAQMRNAFNSTLMSQYDAPQYDALGRREGVTTSGLAFAPTGQPAYDYAYNDRSEVTGAARTLAAAPTDPTAPPAFAFGYQYDTIGNRTQATEWEHTAKTTIYTTNRLNQYPSLTVNAEPPITLTYDLDGNLTKDGMFHYDYDAENRLIAVTPLNSASGLTRTTFAYDYRHRRTQRQVYEWQTDRWSLLAEHWSVYDGWNVIKETTTTASGDSTDVYVWGLDVSGTFQGAGGVGGLLSKANSLTGRTLLYTFDLNGHVGQLIDSNTGRIAAHYEYDPFGNTLVADGPEAEKNPYRFSTKPFDWETGLYAYTFRDYSPRLGRWTTRDPIAEKGGLNLYGFVGNNAVNLIDPSGLLKQDDVWKGRNCYSCICGWLDRVHIDDGGKLWNDISNAMTQYEQSPGQFFTFSLTLRQLSIPFTQNYQLTYDGTKTGNEHLQMALNIFIDFENQFEQYQRTFQGAGWWTKSDFAVDDLPSDFLGFMQAAGKINNWETLCDPLDTDASLKIYNYYIFLKIRKHHYTVKALPLYVH